MKVATAMTAYIDAYDMSSDGYLAADRASAASLAFHDA